MPGDQAQKIILVRKLWEYLEEQQGQISEMAKRAEQARRLALQQRDRLTKEVAAEKERTQNEQAAVLGLNLHVASLIHERSEKDQAIAVMLQQKAELTQTIDLLAAQLHNERATVHGLNLQVATLVHQGSEKDRTIAMLSGSLHEITASTGWALLQKLWRIRFGLAPRGSRRDRWARIGVNLVRRAKANRGRSLRKLVPQPIKGWARRILGRSEGLAPLPAVTSSIQGNKAQPGITHLVPEAPVQIQERPPVEQPVAPQTISVVQEKTQQVVLAPTYDVICLPIINWHFRFQRPQQLMRQFARHGHRVYYATTAFQPGTKADLKEIEPGVMEMLLPGNPHTNLYRQLPTAADVTTGVGAIEQMCLAHGVTNAVVVVQLPFWSAFAEELRRRYGWPIVYDCMDEHAGFSTNEHAMVGAEHKLIKSADLVVGTSDLLYRKIQERAPRALLIRNAGEFEHFCAVQPVVRREPVQNPVVGYYGAIADWFDSDLVADLAETHPEWQFRLIGSTATGDTSRLEKLANVRLLGEKPYGELPGLMADWDCCLIPFKRLPLTEATNPVKVYEMLGGGMPVVAVSLPELKPIAEQGLISLADDAAGFSREIRAAIAGNSQKAITRRRAFAYQNKWEDRFSGLEIGIRELFPSDAGVARLRREGKPVAGYFGALGAWTDFDLLYAVAQLQPNWNFVLIGPHRANGRASHPIFTCPNVIRMISPELPSLAGYVRLFDVAIIPFVGNNFGLATGQLKVCEALAEGKPVVATPVLDPVTFPEVHIAHDATEFAEALERARDQGHDPAFRRLVRERVHEHLSPLSTRQGGEQLATEEQSAPANYLLPFKPPAETQPPAKPVRKVQQYVANYYDPGQKPDGGEETEDRASVFLHPETLRNSLALSRQEIQELFPPAVIVIVSYNNLTYLRLCLESIWTKTLYPNFKVVVVDNGSRPDVIDYLLGTAYWEPRLEVVLNKKNEGFARANNIGIERAGTCDYIVLLNNDTIVTYGWLTRMTRYLDDPRVGLIGPVTNSIGNEAKIDVDYEGAEGIDPFATRYTRDHAGKTFPIAMLAMFCVGMRKSVCDQIGPLDEQFGVGMFEDDDYSERVRRANFQILCAEDIFIHHWGSASFGKLAKEKYCRLFEENRKKFETKWGVKWVQHQYRSKTRV